MRIQLDRTLCIWAMLALPLNTDTCYGQDKADASMNTQISEAEDSWSKGDHRKYYSKAADIAQEIRVNSSKTDLSSAAAKLLENILSKQVDPAEAGTSDLATMQELASYLVSNDDVSAENRRNNVRLLCKYLGKVQKERVPDFKPKPVFENVAPPPGVPGVAGMSPEAIKDPAARAQYEEAIRGNRENRALNARQTKLRSMEWSMRKQLKGYMLKTFKAEDVASTALSECMKDAGFDGKEQKELENQLKGIDSNQGMQKDKKEQKRGAKRARKAPAPEKKGK